MLWAVIVRQPQLPKWIGECGLSIFVFMVDGSFFVSVTGGKEFIDHWVRGLMGH